jgi:hypothetical protein
MVSLFMSLLVSQNLFARTYGGTGYDEAESIIQTSDGGYAVAGYTYGFGAGNRDFLILKIDSIGNLSWVRTFGGAGSDEACSIIQATDGGYAVAGYTRSFGVGDGDFLVLKLDPSGDLSWARTFGGVDWDEARSLVQTQDGGYVIAGVTRSFGAGDRDFLILRLGPSGNLSWARTFGGADYDYANSIVQTQDSGYAVAGYTASFGGGLADVLILKLSSSGGLQWARTFGGTSTEAWSIVQTQDGGYAVAGYTASFGGGGDDALVLRMDSSGNLSWARTFGGVGSDEAFSIIQTFDGGYAVAGLTSSSGAVHYDFLALKLDSSGGRSWGKRFGGVNLDRARSIIQTTDDGFAVAGYTYSFGEGPIDFLVLKINSEGNYPGCVEECSPIVDTLSLSTSSPAGLASCTPDTSSPSPTVTIPNLTITDVCPPAVEEADLSRPRPGITCSPLSGGVLFLSPGEMPLRIYAVDGRLAFSGNLQKGENRVSLGTGVYIWKAGTYRGKTVVR